MFTPLKGEHTLMELNEFSSVDEEDELFTVPWGKETYVKHYPKLNRPSDK